MAELTFFDVVRNKVERNELGTGMPWAEHLAELTELLLVLLDLLQWNLCGAVLVLATVEGVFDDCCCQQASACPHRAPACGAVVSLDMALLPALPVLQTGRADEMASGTGRHRNLSGKPPADAALNQALLLFSFLSFETSAVNSFTRLFVSAQFSMATENEHKT